MDPGLRQRARISVVLVFFTALAILGVVGVGFVVTDYSRARGSVSWAVVDGVVLGHRRGGGDHLRYVYSVNGKPYESTRIRFFTGGLADRQEVSTYKPGVRVNVYVSPRFPGTSVLQPGGSPFVFLSVFLFCGVCVFLGVGGVVRTLEKTVTEAIAPELKT